MLPNMRQADMHIDKLSRRYCVINKGSEPSIETRSKTLRELVLALVVGTRKHVAFICASAIAALVSLSACTSNSSFPSPSISTALTPQESDLESAESQKTEVTESAPQTATSAEQEAKEAETQLALAPTAGDSPSVDAVTTAATSDTTTPTPKAAPAENEKTVVAAKPTAEKTEGETVNEVAATQPKPVATPPVKKKSLFESFFSSSSSTPKNDAGENRKIAARKPAPRVRTVIRERGSSAFVDRRRGNITGLPGVKRKNVFGIDDEIEREEFDEPTRTASIANMATRGTHGLLIQRPDVKVGCFPRGLLRILRQVERRYNRTPIVTSGYRSRRYNRRVRGARKSTHIRCMAADIQVKGISKWQLAKYLRSLPGRGGVGTYCHTKSVHIDIGSKRAWHHCRRSRKKRRRKA